MNNDISNLHWDSMFAIHSLKKETDPSSNKILETSYTHKLVGILTLMKLIYVIN